MGLAVFYEINGSISRSNVFYCLQLYETANPIHFCVPEKSKKGIFSTTDLSMVGGTILYLLTSIFGYGAWKKTIFGLPPGPIMEFCLYLGSMGLAVPVAVRNTYR